MMDITELNEYSDTIWVQLKGSYSLRTIRAMVRMDQENLEPVSIYSIKDFIKKVYRADWSKIYRADREYWYQMIDFIIDHCNEYDNVKFFYEKETTDA